MGQAPPYLFDSKRTPSLWAQGYASASLEKRSNMFGAAAKGFRAAGDLTLRAAKGAKNMYKKTLPNKTWRDNASVAERIAERVGFFSVPAAGALYLKNRQPQRPQPAMYPPAMYNVGQYSLPGR